VNAHRRVLKAVIRRYLEQEVRLYEGNMYKVPRFLLNDVVRFWRTMAVDFARKQTDRGGKGWGIRNVKLRMSRKLIFTGGMLTCFSCPLLPRSKNQDDLQVLISHIEARTQMSPLAILAQACLDGYTDAATSKVLFTQYDAFLQLINQDSTRKKLENLRAEDAGRSKVFQQAHQISLEFQKGLDALFFGSKLKDITTKYAIF